MKRALLLIVLLLFTVGAVFSLDFGLLMKHELEVSNDIVFYSPSFTPWFSWDITKDISVYASGVLFFEYYNYADDSDGSGWAKPEFRFDLSRTAVSWDISDNMSLEAGRVRYSDVLGFSAEGLFDGARFEMSLLPLGTLNAGVFFTGLLYKETALILMSRNDEIRYEEPWDKDFSYYFASSRLLTNVGWEMPLFGEANTLSAEFLVQFDLNTRVDSNAEDKYYHSQYAEVKYEFYPLEEIGLTSGFILETMQNFTGAAAAWGFFAGMGVEMPGTLNDWVNLYVKFTSGSTNKEIPPFKPITSVSQSEVLDNLPLSGLMVISGDYNLRINKTMYTEAFLRYYIRTYDTNNEYAGKFFYGGEIWGAFFWQPFDDFRLTAGGGAFFPSLGDLRPDGTAPKWKVNVTLTMSF